jgi:signal transduction histidine kinase
LARELHDQMG